MRGRPPFPGDAGRAILTRMTRRRMTPTRRALGAVLPALPLMAQAPAPAQLANPSATFCIERGGRFEIWREPGGERGICVLPDGRALDAWAYFRAQRGR